MRPYRLLALFTLAAASGCGLDSVLEGKKIPDGKVSLAVSPSTVSIPLGGEEAFTVTVTRRPVQIARLCQLQCLFGGA